MRISTLTEVRDYYYLLFVSSSFCYTAFVDVQEGVYEGIHWVINVAGAVSLMAFCLLSLLAHYRLGLYIFSAISIAVFVLAASVLVFHEVQLLLYVAMLVIAVSFVNKPPFLHILGTAQVRTIVNFFFIVAVIWCIASYHLGYNPWGYAPGQTTENLNDGLWYRVGLFPFQTPPYSGFFACIVLVINLIDDKGRKNYPVILGAAYFLLLAASRTAYSLVATVLILWVVHERFSKRNYVLLPLFLLCLFLILFLVSNPFVLTVLLPESDLLVSAITRNQADTFEASTRFIMIVEFVRIFLNNLPFGVGSETLANLYQGPGGSEVMFFSSLAAYGLLAASLHSLVLLLFMRNSIKVKLFVIHFIVLSMFYSSGLQPYSFLYLSLILLLGIRANSAPPRGVRAGIVRRGRDHLRARSSQPSWSS